MKNISIEYAHIYTNSHINKEHELSLEILDEVTKGADKDKVSLVVMVDDYSFPDPSFDYEDFKGWLENNGFSADLMIRESQLIQACDAVLKLIEDGKLKNSIADYIKEKKYPCSLFIAAWYLLRLGCIKDCIFPGSEVSNKILNILPESFKPFEEKGIEN